MLAGSVRLAARWEAWPAWDGKRVCHPEEAERPKDLLSAACGRTHVTVDPSLTAFAQDDDGTVAGRRSC